MRRTYISSEYQNTPQYGTFNFLEEANFFGSKMLEIEDSVYISNQNLIYYQQSNGEQVDISIESSLPSYVYSSSSDKESNHKIYIDTDQTQYQKDTNTKWVIDIDINTILDNYLFSILKKYRTFEGIKTQMTKSNDVNSFIKKYISGNVTSRYQYKSIDLYLGYKELKTKNVLKYKTYWNQDIMVESNKYKKVKIDILYDVVRLSFSQEQPSDKYTFDYFFNILFEKI